MLRVAKMSPYDVDEGRIALGGPDRRQMADQPNRGPGNPQTKAEADGGGEGPINDNDRPWRAAQKKRFRERAVDRGVEAGNGLALIHQTSAPPPNASARPVRMMTMTDMTFATGPWMDCRI